MYDDLEHENEFDPAHSEFLWHGFCEEERWCASLPVGAIVVRDRNGHMTVMTMTVAGPHWFIDREVYDWLTDNHYEVQPPAHIVEDQITSLAIHPTDDGLFFKLRWL